MMMMMMMMLLLLLNSLRFICDFEIKDHSRL